MAIDVLAEAQKAMNNGTWSINWTPSSSNTNTNKTTNTSTSTKYNSSSSTPPDWIASSMGNGVLPAYSSNSNNSSSGNSSSYNSNDEYIKEQMRKNSAMWDQADDKGKAQLHEANLILASQLSNPMGYDPKTGSYGYGGSYIPITELKYSDPNYTEYFKNSYYNPNINNQQYDIYNVANLNTSDLNNNLYNNYNPNTMTYDDYFNNSGYLKMLEAQRAARDAYVQQAVNNINKQKTTVNQDAKELARQAYISYMQSKKDLPQQLSAAGYSGGLADSQLLGLDTSLQNNQNSIEQNRSNTLSSLDSAITNAQLQADITSAEQQAAVAQAAIDAFNNYKSQQQQLANNNYWNQKSHDFQVEQAKTAAQQQAQKTAFTNAWNYMQMGLMPSIGVLNAAGISYDDALAYVTKINQQKVTPYST